MEELTLKWSDVPTEWPLCFNDDCPLHQHCLHRQAAAVAPQDLEVARCVTPSALRDGECRHYVSMDPVRYARGFERIYDGVLKKHYTMLRERMTSMLSGKRIYYEYMRGERRLEPIQQECIKELFGKYGYADSVKFDAYEYGYLFKWT